MTISIQEDHEALLQFLYLAPVGLMQTRLDGDIVMVNPLCARFLLPLAGGGAFTNLYDVLGDLVPDLRSRVDDYESASGMVCEGLHLHVFANPTHPLRPPSAHLRVDGAETGRQRPDGGSQRRDEQRAARP